MSAGDELLTVADVAGMLGVSGQTVRTLCRTRQLDHVRVGLRCIRIPRPAADAYRQSRTFLATHEATPPCTTSR